MLLAIEKISWGLATILLFSSGIYFTTKLRYPQFKFKTMWISIKKSGKGLNTLNLTLAAKIGVGSLAGTALAVYIGGIGTIFWMWISMFICVINTYCESFLAVINRKTDKDGSFYGGPSFYIEKMLKNKSLAIIYAITIILAFIGGFLTIQVNTISKVLIDYINIKPVIIGMLVALLTCPIIFGGVNKISDICNKIVPIMTSIYLIATLGIIIVNFESSIIVIKNIILDAFNIKSTVSGIISTMLIGIQRGIFSNEAGIGTSAITAATVKDNFAKEQGYIQMIGVYIATLVICTTTAIVIMLSDYNTLSVIDPNGIEITKYAFNYHMGSLGTIMIIVTIILFAYSTIITGYYYGEANLKYLMKDSKKGIFILKIITLILLVLGSILSSTIIWSIADILVAVMAIINVYAIFKLRKHIKN